MLRTQQERYTFEMLLDAEWISWGRYYMRRDAVNGNKYWDEHGNEITPADTVRLGIRNSNRRLSDWHGQEIEGTGDANKAG